MDVIEETEAQNIEDRELLIQESENHQSEVHSAAEAFDDTPKDTFYFCHFAFFIIGICQLLPWNFLLNASNVSSH